jgi:hypothetical protein
MRESAPAEKGLEEAMADQPGIDEVFAEDRELYS